MGFNDTTVLFAATTVLILGAAVWCARGVNAEKTDFSLTYVGAKIVHDGLGRDLYDIGLQKQLRDSLFEHPSPLLFEHPPFEALFLSPLAAFPYRTAFLVWAVFNGLIWISLIQFMRPLLNWPRDDLGYLILWLLFAPLGVALYQGQSSLVLLALYAVTFVCLKRGKEVLAGLAIGLGLFKFQFVLPFVLIMLLRRKWRFILGVATASTFLLLLSLIAVGWVGLTTYIRLLLTISGNPQNESFGSAVDMPTLYGLLYVIIGLKISLELFNIILATLSVLVITFVAWRWRHNLSGSPFNLMFAAAIAISLVTSSHMFTHDFSPLILAMFLAAASVTTKSSFSLLLTVPLAFFWAFPVYFMFVARHCLYLMCPVLLLFAYVAIRTAQQLGQLERTNRAGGSSVVGAPC